MNPFLKYLLAALAGALGCILALTIVSPAYVMLGDEVTLGEAVLGATGILPFALIIGLPVAVPVSALLGGVMLVLEKRTGRALSLSAWIIVGLSAGIVISLFFGRSDPVWPVRVASAIWFGLGGAAGAWLFRRVHRGRH